MPLYETVMQEKPPVILDIGTAYTKLGFAAEAYPRKIMPSEVILSTTGKTKPLFEYDSTLDLYDQLVDFLQMVFFKHLLVSPKERKIVVVEDVFGQTIVRETLARVLFRHFEVSSVMFVPAHLISLSTLGVDTGVVVDMGYTETTVLPVFCGVQIMQAFQDQPYGGKMVHEQIKQKLVENGSNPKYLDESILEDIKVRTCFVTNLDRAKGYRNNEPPAEAPAIEYPIADDEVATITGKIRETSFEFMFEDSIERDSLPHMIMKALLKCPIDLRKPLAESIYVIGGGSMIMGILPRLKAELQYLLANDEEYKQKFHSDIKFKFHKGIGRPNFAAWLGGSLCGGTDLLSVRSLTKEAYLKNEHVPDWICLSDNRLAGS